MSSDPNEWPGTEKADRCNICENGRTAPPPRYGGFGPPSEEMPLMYPAGTQRHPLWHDWPFATPSSMRNVDADCAARPLAGGYGEAGTLLNRPYEKPSREEELFAVMPNLRPIRRAQLISPFGIGALVEFPGRRISHDSRVGRMAVREATSARPTGLYKRSASRLRLSTPPIFRLPPEHREPSQGVEHANQVHSISSGFPRWHYCPRRGAMERLSRCTAAAG